MPHSHSTAPTFESQINEFIENITPFLTDLEGQWKNTDVYALFDAKHIFKKFGNIYQAIIDSLIYVSAATLVALCVAAITAIISKILFAISLALWFKAAYHVFKNEDDSAVEMGLYSTSTLLLSYLVNMTSPILTIGTLALLVYKSSNLIERALPDEFKDTWTSRAQGFFQTMNNKIDETQAYLKSQFGM